LEVNGDKNVRSVPGERKGPAPVKHTPKAKGKGKEKEKEGVEGWKDEQEDSDGGEWINPSNVSKHRSKDLGLVPAGGGSDQSPMAAACMTGDYAVQNVLLSMGLGLIGEQGKRINKVKSWVLRCHACFKYVHPSSFIPIC
jgi:RNA-binding protein NOB1